MTFVKICGLADEAAVDAALEAGADAVGFVMFEKSPRHVAPARAAALAAPARGRAIVVAVVVNPSAAAARAIKTALAPDAWQLHGGDLDPATAERAETWRAVHVADENALPDKDAAAGVDRFLLDAPPLKGTRPGGWGVPFDWRLLKGWSAPRPWILSGGLSPQNVAEAIALSGAEAVDVSSGVESAPGVKDPAKIAAFVAAAKAAQPLGATS